MKQAEIAKQKKINFIPPKVAPKYLKTKFESASKKY